MPGQAFASGGQTDPRFFINSFVKLRVINQISIGHSGSKARTDYKMMNLLALLGVLFLVSAQGSADVWPCDKAEAIRQFKLKRFAFHFMQLLNSRSD